jgi:hypothetical protein
VHCTGFAEVEGGWVGFGRLGERERMNKLTTESNGTGVLTGTAEPV